MGAWIETGWRTLRPSYLWSHPSWVRGLKLVLQAVGIDDAVVAPLVGAWIETSCLITKRSQSVVAPLVGAWIETYYHEHGNGNYSVAPLVGAWIET